MRQPEPERNFGSRCAELAQVQATTEDSLPAARLGGARGARSASEHAEPSTDANTLEASRKGETASAVRGKNACRGK
jgi:hypothetical protein